MTSRVSPNGEYLAFMSERSLTGYDNEDANPEAMGARDEEVYLYDASSEGLVCASCNPSGARPEGVLDANANFEGKGSLLVDPMKIWTTSSSPYEYRLAGSLPGWTPLDPDLSVYQSRYLSNSGRLFFNSPEDLVPNAEGNKEKVYEYEPDEEGSCKSTGGCVGLISSPNAKYESEFLDASTSGNDVFFLTRERLVQQDEDENFDVYDARVCEPSSCLKAPSSGTPACKEIAECRPGPYSAPSFEAAASTSSSSSGNIATREVLSEKVVSRPKPLTSAQKLANALKACRKDKKKSKRLACEKQARKKYGPKKPKKAKKTKAKKSSAGRRAR
jgi:hypothetical protein